MMLKANNEILDFNDLIEVEKQIKLFEDVATTDGDFSYQFDIDKTLHNTRVLGNPLPDNINKLTYTKIPSELLSDSGSETFKGYLRIEQITNVYKCSFFAGNNNWFGMLSEPLRSLDWSEYDIIQDQIAIQNAILSTDGLVFPLVDNGLLGFRGAPTLKIQDFVAAIYVKDVFRKVFNAHGIKIQGELLNDVNYLSAITINNGKNADQISARGAFVHTTNAPTGHGTSSYVKIVWTNDSVFPYYDGASNNFDLINSRYVADVPMIVKVTWVINDLIAPGIGIYAMDFYLNGVYDFEKVFEPAPAQPLTITKTYRLNAGDFIEAYILDDAQLFNDPLQDSTIKFEPIYIFEALGASSVPDWTQQEYVSSVLRLFNVLPSYDANNKTLTFNLFEKIKSKPEIDISQYITSTTPDYSEFISDYGKKSLLSFTELEVNDDFRAKNYTVNSYEKGIIEIENDFINDQVDILESEFTAPITYINPFFDMSMAKTDLIDVETMETTNSTGVTSGTGGRARFAIDEDIFSLGDLVRISESSNNSYNGDFVVYTIGAGYVEFVLLSFSTDANSKIAKLNYVYGDSDNVYILHHIPAYNISKFSSKSEFVIENTNIETWAPAFSEVIDNGKSITYDFVYSMNFTGQITLVSQYFALASRVLNDPVKLFCEAYLPYAVFMSIDFLSPIKVVTEETQNLYYLNRISGYKESYLPCILELIKLP